MKVSTTPTIKVSTPLSLRMSEYTVGNLRIEIVRTGPAFREILNPIHMEESRIEMPGTDVTQSDTHDTLLQINPAKTSIEQVIAFHGEEVADAIRHEFNHGGP